MNTFTIEEQIGKELNRELINFMVQHRVRDYGENTKDFENDERESIFFFLKEDEEIYAFGMLKPVIVYYAGKEYPILGMGNVMAIQKGKGYGKMLVNHIRTFLDKSGHVCIGNTHKDNFRFYEKCGFTFIPGLVDRFVYIDEHGKRYTGQDWTDYAMFIYDQDNNLDEVINGKDDVVIKIPLW